MKVEEELHFSSNLPPNFNGLMASQIPRVKGKPVDLTCNPEGHFNRNRKPPKPKHFKMKKNIKVSGLYRKKVLVEKPEENVHRAKFGR